MTNVTQVEVGSVVVMLSYRRGDNRLVLPLESTQKANPSLRSAVTRRVSRLDSA